MFVHDADYFKFHDHQNWLPAQTKIWVAATLYFFKFMP